MLWSNFDVQPWESGMRDSFVIYGIVNVGIEQWTKQCEVWSWKISLLARKVRNDPSTRRRRDLSTRNFVILHALPTSYPFSLSLSLSPFPTFAFSLFIFTTLQSLGFALETVTLLPSTLREETYIILARVSTPHEIWTEHSLIHLAYPRAVSNRQSFSCATVGLS